MTQSIPILSLTTTLTAPVAQHRFVSYNGDPGQQGDGVLGVSRVAGVAGDEITVDSMGTTIIEAGAAIAVGDPLEPGADGKAAVAGDVGFSARALEAAAADGDLIECLLIVN